MRKDPHGNELLRGMHYKHGAYYFVRHNKWRLLGRTYNAALKAYAGAQEAPGAMPRLIKQTYDVYSLRARQGDLAPSTHEGYNVVKPKLLEVFAQIDPVDVTPSHIRQFLAHCYGASPGMANRALVVLRGVFDYGIEQGVCDYNPAAQVKLKKGRVRSRRMTDAEFARIRHCAKGQLPLIMDVLYYTGQRIGDVLAIRQSDISNGVLRITQQKTGALIDIQIGPELEQVILEARRTRVAGLWLFSRNGKPLRYGTIHKAFQAACVAARVEGCTIRDIRAKTITDIAVDGGDAQDLAGHSDAKMTRRYVKEKVAKKVKSLDGFKQEKQR